MTEWFYRWLGGWVEVSLRHGAEEDALSRIVMSGQRLWKIARDGEGVHFVAGLAGIGAIRRAARGCQVTVSFGRRGGAPFQCKSLRRRPFLLVGLLCAVLLLEMAVTRVWVVSVAGGLPLAQQAQIVQAARDSGLGPGTPKGAVQVNAIRRAMQKRLPRYAWIGIQIHGVVATIQTVPWTARPAAHVVPRLVADRSGRITGVWVYMGEPMVAVGDWVRRGQVLVRGGVTGLVPTPKDGQAVQPGVAVTPAEAAVWAEVRYQAEVFQPFHAVQYHTTGRTFTTVTVTLDQGPPILVWGLGPVPFRHYQVTKRETPVMWADVVLPAEMTKMIYNETIRSSMIYRPNVALRLATKAAEQRLQNDVPKAGTVLDRRCVTRWTRTGVWVDVMWTVSQDIARAPRNP
ncbi:MAG: sporulation protein YqfD [Thermaerobacter sp.]|nr:sporulation protein YqfD [Thermaerobacter sp.]